LPASALADGPLWALSPLDGRYGVHSEALKPYLSEGALFSYRVKVEAAWLLFLAEHPEVGSKIDLTAKGRKTLEALVSEVPVSAVEAIKAFEKTTNHDVKAVEYWLRDVLEGESNKVKAHIHFACTSEDINSCSWAMMLKDARDEVLLPTMNNLLSTLESMSHRWSNLPMMSRTHGQPATPTTLGKEVSVFAHRLQRLKEQLAEIKPEGKMSGAVGNYNAHKVAWPKLAWPEISREFIEEKLGVSQNPLTTQIESHDWIAAYCNSLADISTVAIGLAQDMWGYISLGYFKLAVKKGEVGSSTMPHKVNPIDFEGAEGHLLMARSVARQLSEKLPISRFQRDLSDSTSLRNLATMCGHALVGLRSLIKGLNKISADEKRIHEDLKDSWELLGEAAQTLMRKYGVADAYERLKSASRGKQIDAKTLHSIVNKCTDIPDVERKAFMKLTPSSYLGFASELALSLTKADKSRDVSPKKVRHKKGGKR